MIESFLKLTGALGTVLICNTAPLPVREVKEGPIMLIATTCANTLAPVAKFQGPAVSFVIGIEQVSASLILAVPPLQF